MLSKEKVNRVLKLKEQGMSVREISKIERMSKGTVVSILNGTHPHLRPPLPPRKKPNDDLPIVVHPDSVQGDVRAIAYERCPDCGGKVQADVPCLHCKLTRDRKRNGKPTNFAEVIRPLYTEAPQPVDEWFEQLLGPPLTENPYVAYT